MADVSRAEDGFEAWFKAEGQHLIPPDSGVHYVNGYRAMRAVWHAREAQSRAAAEAVGYRNLQRRIQQDADTIQDLYAAVEAAEREGVLKIIRIVEDWCRSHSGETVHLGMLRVAMAELREVAESLAARSGQEVWGG